jgi:flagellin-specific chaperone FliS
MLAQRTPHEAYRRVDFDARVAGANPAQLVSLCCEQVAGALGTALHAAGRGDNALKSQSLTRALSAVTALQFGVSGEDGIAGALRRLYGAARGAILDSAVAFDAATIAAIRDDFLEIGKAMQAA